MNTRSALFALALIVIPPLVTGADEGQIHLALSGEWTGNAKDGTEISYSFGKEGTVVWRVNEKNFTQAFPEGLAAKYQIRAGRLCEIDIYDFTDPRFKDIRFQGILEITDSRTFKMEGLPSNQGDRPKAFTEDAIVFRVKNKGEPRSDPSVSKPLREVPKERFEIVRDPELGKPLVSWRSPPKDARGRQGVDVLEQFLLHVRDGEVDQAKRLCRFSVGTSIDAGSGGHVTAMNLPVEATYLAQAQAKLAALEAGFPQLVEKLRRAKRYTLGATVKQKSIYWTIKLVAEGVEQQPWPVVGLCYEDGAWEIMMYEHVVSGPAGGQ